MKQFEYKTVRYFSREGQSFADWLNEFGDDGWQLVISEGDEYYTFMRERE